MLFFFTTLLQIKTQINHTFKPLNFHWNWQANEMHSSIQNSDCKHTLLVYWSFFYTRTIETRRFLILFVIFTRQGLNLIFISWPLLISSNFLFGVAIFNWHLSFIKIHQCHFIYSQNQSKPVNSWLTKIPCIQLWPLIFIPAILLLRQPLFGRQTQFVLVSLLKRKAWHLCGAKQAFACQWPFYR